MVVSEGEGAEWLERRARARGLENLVRLDFQPFHRMPEVLASADVLVAVLEAEAGVFSVPSKVLTYLAAGRPIAAAVPADNLAARTLLRSGGGCVVRPDDPTALSALVLELLDDEVRRHDLGDRGRKYAEREFDIRAIGDRFERVLSG